MKREARRLVRMGAAVAALGALLGAGCGSGLTHEQMLRANSEAFRLRSGSAAADPGTTPLTPAAPTVAAGAATGGSSLSSAAVTGAAPSPGVTSAGTASPNTSSGALPAAGGSRPSTAGAAPSASKQPIGQPASGTKASGAATGVPAAPAAPGSRSEIRLGSIGQQSGPIGGALLPIIHGAKAWGADVNARGGLAGHPVRIIFADDGGDPSRALSLAKRMVEQDKVLALFDGQMALTLQAITPYLEERKVPFIHNTPSAPDDDKSPMVFVATTGSGAGTQWAHVAGLLKFAPDKRKIAILYCREAQTCPLLAAGAKKYAEAAGRQVVNEQQISIAQPDFTAEIIAARNAGAEVIIPIADNASTIRIIRSAKRQGWNPVISSQMASHDERFLEVGGADVEGSVHGGELPWATSQHPIIAAYRSAIDRYVPGGVKASLGAAAYVAGRLLEVVAAGFPPEPTSQDVLNGYWALRGETLGGLLPPISFAREGGHAGTNPCVIPVVVRDGKFVEGTEYSCPPGYTRPS